MPELPEVEVTRRRIAPLLVGRRIARARVGAPSYVYVTSPRTLARRLQGRTALGLHRIGKYLLLDFEGDHHLVIHLGMTGQLFSGAARSVRLLSATARSALRPEEQQGFEPDAHTHLVLDFDDGGPRVFFRDVRKFGKIFWLGPGEGHPRLDRLGPDALVIGGDELFRLTRGRDTAIKNRLLDQAALAGVGNIYADEALFRAGIRPTRRAQRLSQADCERLAGEIRAVLARSIETGGSSIRDYVTPDGSDGGYQDERFVYARGGEPCRVCGTRIRRSVLGQRGTHHCPRCQR